MPPSRLYFAYGNNLSLERMARYCPGSIYIGRAVLPHHRFHINEMGIANIMPAEGFEVHGLVYKLTFHDQKSLDRAERVHDGVYSKESKYVILYRASDALSMNTQWMLEDGGPAQVTRSAHRRSMPIREQGAYFGAEVMVYLSKHFVQDSWPRDWYVDQMNSGIRNAKSLHIPATYFNNIVRRWIPKRKTPRSVNQRWDRHALTTRSFGSWAGTSNMGSRNWASRSNQEHKTPQFIVEIMHYGA
ncbi:hypothetical protein NUW58_g3200 [Xylaria curta]|uniref:Uncharacterized protein n=1 Tax=Xylaria curta TaxID=42375 RepID=A0ACC1PF54_9PEZI|nr:hypothetical protein NUW58_g3200 [Xylaria curta]